MLFISLVEHIKNLDDDLEYDPGDTTNTIVIGNFVSKFAKESTSMRESLSKLESLLQSDPENEEFMVSIGNTLLWLNDYTEAQKVFKRILEKNNKNFDAWFNLAKIYFNRKNVKQCE